MRTVLMMSLRIYARRYVAAAIAVVVSVAFVVTTGMLIAGARAGLMASDGAPYRGADLVIVSDPTHGQRGPACCPETLDKAAAIALTTRLGDNAAGHGRVLLPVRRVSGAPLGAGETTVGPVASAPELVWQKLVSGRFPIRAGEAVMHVWDANALNVSLGTALRVGKGASAVDLTVVGIVESPSTWKQASLYVTWPQYLSWYEQPTFHIGDISVRGEIGPLPEGMISVRAADFVRQGLAGLNRGIDTFALMLLLFAAVALSVSALVISNTFSILFAQRLREFALLRCVGATRRQIVHAIQLEAAAVGVLASLTGVALGIGVGFASISLINVLALRAPMRTPVPPPAWLLSAFALGVLVTLVSSWLPTRTISSVSPLDALRPRGVIDMPKGRGVVRRGFSVALLSAGVATLWVAIVVASRPVMLAGGALFLVGLLVIGPVVVPVLFRSIGARLGFTGRLAAQNAARNPQRTATTTAALLFGVTLTAASVTTLSTWRTAIDAHRNVRLPIDVALVARDGSLPGDVLDAVRRVPGVERAVAVRGAIASISGWGAPIAVVSEPDAAAVARDGGRFARVQPGMIHLDYSAFRTPNTTIDIRPGDEATVCVGERCVTLKVIFLSGWGQTAVVARETLAQLIDVPEPHVVWVRAARTAETIAVARDLDRLAASYGLEVEDQLQARSAGNRQIDILTWSVLGLLGLSVTIALIGIANTLSLSVLERAREHALLRALGLTRGGLRRMLALEALQMAMIAGVLGTTLGVGFAWVAFRTVIQPILKSAVMQVPLLALGCVVVIAGVAGLLASIVPARRASGVSPVAGLALK